MRRFPALILCYVALLLPVAQPATVSELWSERLKSVVGVEFLVDSETGRQATETAGVVIDDAGTIIIPGETVNNRISPGQLRDFHVYLPGADAGRYFTAEYLGQDELSGWHFIRVEFSGRAALVPITRYVKTSQPEPAVAEELWGIGLRKKNEDFAPFFLSSRVAIIQSLPQRTAVLAHDVGSHGLPVFNGQGDFVGLVVGGYGETYLQFSARDQAGMPVLMVNPGESSAVILAQELLPNLKRVPENIAGRPLAWLGANSLQPLDPEVAAYMKLEAPALMVGDILEGSPAEKAGLRERDVILRLDGRELPRIKPQRGLTTYLEREVDRRLPGEAMTLQILRDGRPLEVVVKLEDAPQLPREAPRQYFDFLGITVRGFTYADGAVRRVKLAEHRGVIAHFVKPASAVAAAGLRLDDWIKEIDGTPVPDYETAVRLLAAVEADRSRTDFTLRVERAGEEAVLPVKLR